MDFAWVVSTFWDGEKSEAPEDSQRMRLLTGLACILHVAAL